MFEALLAQAGTGGTIGTTLIQALANNGIWVFLGICVISATAKQLIQMILKHQERIAMIQSGIKPDPEPTVYPTGFTTDNPKQAG